MLDEGQEELAEWWRDNPGLHDKSNETYRRKARKDKLIADKATHMGGRSSPAGWLDEDHEDHVWQGGEEVHGEEWGCSPYPHLTAILGS